MSFPWKKVKNTRISQLVSDHIDSQRRRSGHLVVETGFPTSLVDLFVKNRERLKKQKPPKTKKARNHDSPSPISKPPLPLPPPSPSPSPSRSPSRSDQCPPPFLVSPSPPQFDSDGQEADEVGKGTNEGANPKGVLVGAALRIFFVVVLALGTKKFAVGLTMSAFLLLFVEYVGKYLCRLLMPCSEAKETMRVMIFRVLRVIGIREDRLEEGDKSLKGQKEPIEHQCSQLKNNGFGSPVREIQIAQPMGALVPLEEEIGNCDRKAEIEIKGEMNWNLETQGSNSKTVILGNDDEYSFKGKKSKRVKLKSKMKHLFPRKLKSSKKEEPDLEGGEPDLVGGEMSSNKEKPVSVCEGREETKNQDGRELECASNLSSFSSGRFGENDALSMISCSDVCWAEDEEAICSKEEDDNGKAGKSGYLILCLIVLIGLFGGRISALLLLLLWCLMLKSGGKLRRYMKLPAISSIDQTSR